MNIEDLFGNPDLLNKRYSFYISKNLLRKIPKNKELSIAHLEKAKHNLFFFDKNADDEDFNDWLIVTLYYALYHAVLALIVNKGFTSKNHTASLIFLIKHYVKFKDEINLLNELSIKKEDAELYTDLKWERHKASYESKTLFNKSLINNYKEKVIQFIHKTEELIENSD